MDQKLQRCTELELEMRNLSDKLFSFCCGSACLLSEDDLVELNKISNRAKEIRSEFEMIREWYKNQLWHAKHTRNKKTTRELEKCVKNVEGMVSRAQRIVTISWDILHENTPPDTDDGSSVAHISRNSATPSNQKDEYIAFNFAVNYP